MKESVKKSRVFQSSPTQIIFPFNVFLTSQLALKACRNAPQWLKIDKFESLNVSTSH